MIPALEEKRSQVYRLLTANYERQVASYDQQMADYHAGRLIDLGAIHRLLDKQRPRPVTMDDVRRLPMGHLDTLIRTYGNTGQRHIW